MKRGFVVLLLFISVFFMLGCQSTGDATRYFVRGEGFDAVPSVRTITPSDVGTWLVIKLDQPQENRFSFSSSHYQEFNLTQYKIFKTIVGSTPPVERGMTHSITLVETDETIFFANEEPLITEEFLENGEMNLVDHEHQVKEKIIIKIPLENSTFETPYTLRIKDLRNNVVQSIRVGETKPTSIKPTSFLGKSLSQLRSSRIQKSTIQKSTVRLNPRYKRSRSITGRAASSPSCEPKLKEVFANHNNMNDKSRINLIHYGFHSNSASNPYGYSKDEFITLVKNINDLPGHRQGNQEFGGLFSHHPFSSNIHKFNFWYYDDLLGTVGAPHESYQDESGKCLCASIKNPVHKGVMESCGLKNLNTFSFSLCPTTCSLITPSNYPASIKNLAKIHSHEMGHAFGLLGDEYNVLKADDSLPIVNKYPNCASSTDTFSKWWDPVFSIDEKELRTGCVNRANNVYAFKTIMSSYDLEDNSFGIVNEFHLCHEIFRRAGSVDNCDAFFKACIVEVNGRQVNSCDGDIREWTCNDGFDGDFDGLIDCADPDCYPEGWVNPQGKFVSGSCEENKELTCNDDIDNDGDGKKDCKDSDCSSTISCRKEVCNNNIDDNGDSNIDCADTACFSSSFCHLRECTQDSSCGDVWSCQNGRCYLKASSDPTINADEALAACKAQEYENFVFKFPVGSLCVDIENDLASCSNGLDDDLNGLVDCQEPACQSIGSCS